MAGVRDLVKRRHAVRNIRKITHTMELVATAKLQRAQHAAVSLADYARLLGEGVADLGAAGAAGGHPLLRVRTPVRRAVLIVIASDRGLCGAFNANVLRLGRDALRRMAEAAVEVEVFAIGKKAVTSLTYQGVRIARQWTGASDRPRFEQADRIAGELIDRFEREEIDEVRVVWNEFRSLFSQVPREERILPLATEGGAEESGAGSASRPEYIFHPDPATILAHILPVAAKTRLFHAMLQSAAGEHAARRLAMKNATDSADDMIAAITRIYNRARQAKITREISEIVGGAESL